jgi:hypothetical protein
MIKYSLQNECLENIEAFSDEQMNREMAVIESVLEIYDKTILMMELSNSDVDIPDCSMFMESTFFQEAPTENPQPTNGGEGGEVGQSAPADQDGQQQNSTQNNDNQNNNNNTQKTPPTEAERKKYNSEHQFRQMNKKGNIENMFISIIAFIPRLFGFLIQSIVKLFKKIGNKKADNAINNTDKNLSNLSDEQKSELAAEISKQQSSDTSGAPSTDSQGQNNPSQQPQNNPSQQPQNNPQNNPTPKNIGDLDVVSGTYTWWDQSIGNFLENCKKALESINFSDPKKFINNSGEAIKQLSEIVNSYLQNPTQTAKTFKFQNLSGSTLVKSKNFIIQKLEEVKTLAESKSKESEEMKLPFIKKGDEKRYLESAKNSVQQLKSIIQQLSGFTTTFWIGVERAARNALAVENLINSQQQPQPQIQNNPSQQSSQTGQPQIQQPQLGGENNGEQNQNNQSNAG